jgi:hypothetical protein
LIRGVICLQFKAPSIDQLKISIGKEQNGHPSGKLSRKTD